MVSHLSVKWLWQQYHFIFENCSDDRRFEIERPKQFDMHRRGTALASDREWLGVPLSRRRDPVRSVRRPGPRRFALDHGHPIVLGYLVGLAQVAGAIAVLTGILTRVGAAALSIVMLGAIFLVHLPNGFDVSNGGMEYALTQLLVALALILAGPGAYSLAPRLPPALRKL